MNANTRNSFFPSPLVSEVGDGFLEGYPSPGRSLRSRPLSPPRGEGKARAR